MKAGDVILHDRFEAHLDRFSGARTRVLNLPLRIGHSFTPGAARVADADLVARTAEGNPEEASDLLLSMIDEIRPAHADWPDALAEAMLQDPCLRLSQWAAEQHLAPWAVSRGFKQVFEATPESFRARVRTLRAWKAIRTTNQPLSRIAIELGFADQSHMTRSVKQITGTPPEAWRPANRFKTTKVSGA